MICDRFGFPIHRNRDGRAVFEMLNYSIGYPICFRAARTSAIGIF
jgi:hypothetical protein